MYGVVAQRARRNAAADGGATHGGGGTASRGDGEEAASVNDVSVAAALRAAKRMEVTGAIAATCRNHCCNLQEDLFYRHGIWMNLFSGQLVDLFRRMKRYGYSIGGTEAAKLVVPFVRLVGRCCRLFLVTRTSSALCTASSWSLAQ